MREFYSIFYLHETIPATQGAINQAPTRHTKPITKSATPKRTNSLALCFGNHPRYRRPTTSKAKTKATFFNSTLEGSQSIEEFLMRIRSRFK